MAGARGNTVLKIGGKDVTFSLTIGAIMEIEEALKLKSIGELYERLNSPTTTDVITIAAAMAKAGGSDLTMADWKEIEFGTDTIPNILEAVAAAFDDDDDDDDDGDDKSEPQERDATAEKKP